MALNVLLLHSHDTGRALSAYGSSVSTPAIDRLAREGTLFTRAFCAAPTCTPSRCAMLTGRYAHEVGALGLSHRGFPLQRTDLHLARILKQAGYTTVLAGIQHEVATRTDTEISEALGYQQVLRFETEPDMVQRDRSVAGAAADFIRLRPAGAAPFFLSVGFFATHRPFPDARAEDDSWATDWSNFRRSAAGLDEGVDAVLDALARSKVADRTLVIFTTDHGPPFPGMKCSLKDAGLGVSLILRLPTGPAAVRTVTEPVSHLDLVPTLFDLLELPGGPALRGRTLRPLLEGRPTAKREALFAEINFHAAYEPCRCIRTADHKLIRRFHPYPRPVLPNIDDGGARREFCAGGRHLEPVAERELFDLSRDPEEWVNLAGSPSLRTIEHDLGRRLHDWMVQTNDPLLQGPLVAPPDAKVEPQAAAGGTGPE